MRSFQPGLFHVVVSTFQNPSPDPKSPARTKLSVVLHKHVQVPGTGTQPPWWWRIHQIFQLSYSNYM
jgi:hypothetical protein